jgi:nucleotide-binding universal stress UspA family protein
MNDIIPLTYKTIPRILCATDLSPRCESAVRRAALLAKQMDALLLLVHVVDDAQPQEVIASEVKRARIALEARQLTSAAEIAVRVGRPDRTIARVVGEWDPDLVVLGAYRERPGERLFGTTAERVIRAGARPLLLVNREPSGPYRDVLLASDPSDAFARVIRMTQQLGLLEGANASIVHVLPQATRSMFYPAGITKSEIEQLMHSLRWSARRDLVAQLDAAGLDSAHFRIVQKHGSPTDAIESAVKQVGPQLLVIGATHRPILKRLLGASVAHEVLRAIDCDVLIASMSRARLSREGLARLAIPDASAAQWPTYW